MTQAEVSALTQIRVLGRLAKECQDAIDAAKANARPNTDLDEVERAVLREFLPIQIEAHKRYGMAAGSLERALEAVSRRVPEIPQTRN